MLLKLKKYDNIFQVNIIYYVPSYLSAKERNFKNDKNCHALYHCRFYIGRVQGHKPSNHYLCYLIEE